MPWSCHKHIPITIMSILEWNLHDMNEMLLLMIHVSSPHRLFSTCNMPCMKTVSKQKYLFYLWQILRYKYVGQSSEVNLLDNSPKQFIGLSDVNCWTISQHNSSDNLPIQFYCFGHTPIIIMLTTLRYKLVDILR